MKRKCMIWGLTLFFCCILSSCSPLSGTNSELETSQISSSYAESSTDHTHDSSAHSLNFATIEMDLSDAEEIYHLSTGKIYQYLGKWEDTRFFLLRMSESNKDSINEYYAIGSAKHNLSGGEISVWKKLPDFHNDIYWNGPNLINGNIYLASWNGIFEITQEKECREIVSNKESVQAFRGSEREILYSYVEKKDDTHFCRYIEGYSPLSGEKHVYRKLVYQRNDQIVTGEWLNTAGTVSENGFYYAVSSLQDIDLADSYSIPVTIFYQSFSDEKPETIIENAYYVWFLFGDEHAVLTTRAAGALPAASIYSAVDGQMIREDFPKEAGDRISYHSCSKYKDNYRFSSGDKLFEVFPKERLLTEYDIRDLSGEFSEFIMSYWSPDETSCNIITSNSESILFFTPEK